VSFPLVSADISYITFYASGSNDGGSPQTEAGSSLAAETSNWGIPSGTYGAVSYNFVDADGTASQPNFYYNPGVSYNLRAAMNPAVASRSPRVTGNSYSTADQVYLRWVRPA